MKKWYASKTFWFNVLALIAAVASQFGYDGVLPEEWQVFVPVLVLLVNMVLRLFFTKEPIERKLI
jgi:hypothetical protein